MLKETSQRVSNNKQIVNNSQQINAFSYYPSRCHTAVLFSSISPCQRRITLNVTQETSGEGRWISTEAYLFRNVFPHSFAAFLYFHTSSPSLCLRCHALKQRHKLHIYSLYGISGTFLSTRLFSNVLNSSPLRGEILNFLVPWTSLRVCWNP